MEYALFYISAFFYVMEFIFGIITISKIITTQTALFYLRNAPLVDRKFNMMMKNRDMAVKSSREIAVGLKKVRENTAHDNTYIKAVE